MNALADRYLPRVQVKAAGLENLLHLDAPVVLAANHASRLDLGFVLRAAPARVKASPLPASVAVRLGRSPVVFPEQGLSPDGSLGRFHAGALPAAVRQCPVVPVAIRGTLGLDAEPSRWHGDATPRVFVRFGAALTAPSPDALRDAIAALLLEDETTWWAALTAGPAAGGSPQPAPGTRTGAEGGWLTAWQGLAPVRRPGDSRRPTIWR